MDGFISFWHLYVTNCHGSTCSSMFSLCVFVLPPQLPQCLLPLVYVCVCVCLGNSSALCSPHPSAHLLLMTHQLFNHMSPDCSARPVVFWPLVTQYLAKFWVTSCASLVLMLTSDLLCHCQCHHTQLLTASQSSSLSIHHHSLQTSFQSQPFSSHSHSPVTARQFSPFPPHLPACWPSFLLITPFISFSIKDTIAFFLFLESAVGSNHTDICDKHIADWFWMCSNLNRAVTVEACTLYFLWTQIWWIHGCRYFWLSCSSARCAEFYPACTLPLNMFKWLM